MKRDPSIHIRRSDLIEILFQLGIKSADNVANKILHKALAYNIRNRVYIDIKLKSTSRKKVKRLTEIEDDIVERFNRIYNAVMLEKSIKTPQIHKNSKLYFTLKEISNQAVECCRLHNMQITDNNLKLYIEIGIDLLGRDFTIYRLKGANLKIIKRIESLHILYKDPNPDFTQAIYKAWKKMVKIYYGSEFEIDNPDKFVAFCLAAQDAKKHNATAEDWIQAQFEKFSFLGVIPEFTQLYGDDAVLAYHKFCITKNRMEHKYIERDEKKIPIKKAKRQESKDKTGV